MHDLRKGSANGSPYLPPRRKAGFPRACHDRSCAHAGRHSAEVQHFADRGVHQSQERNLDCAKLFRTGSEFRRAAFLGA